MRPGRGDFLHCGPSLKVLALILGSLACNALRNRFGTLKSFGRIKENAILAGMEVGIALWTLAGEFDLAKTLGQLDSAHGAPSDFMNTRHARGSGALT